MPGDPALPAGQFDFAPWQAARLVSGAALDAAAAWARPVPESCALDVAWDLHKTFGDLRIALWRLAGFRPEPPPGRERSTDPDIAAAEGPEEPGKYIRLAGNVLGHAGDGLRDRRVLAHAEHEIARGLPVGGDPGGGPEAVAAALALADAAASARRIMPGPGVIFVPAAGIYERDQATAAFMRGLGNLDAAMGNLAAHVPGPHADRLAPARAGLNRAGRLLREALICSAVDFSQPGSREQARAMRDRYPGLPSRRPDPAARLAAMAFPGTVIEAIDSITTSAAARQAGSSRLAVRQPAARPGRIASS